MRKFRSSHGGILCLAIALVAIFGGCRTYDARSDWDEAFAFDALRRFHFEDPPTVEGVNPFADNTLLRKRVRATIESVLVERGFAAAGTQADADFVVTYQVLLEDQIRVDGFTTGTGVGYRPYGAVGGLGATAYSSTRVNAFQEATLLIDVLAPDTGELAWRGWGRGMLTTRDRDRSAERLLDGVRAILESFPPNAD